VLKGANSAALYGSAASNGVLMITTKKGKEGQIRIDVSSSTTFETPLKLPKLQNRYGAQMSGSVENGFTMNSNSWGQRMNTLGDEYYDTANSPYHLTRNAYDISDFYRVGTNFNNSIALSEVQKWHKPISLTEIPQPTVSSKPINSNGTTSR